MVRCGGRNCDGKLGSWEKKEDVKEGGPRR